MNPPGIPQVGINYLRTQATALMPSTVTIKRPGITSYDATTGLATGITESVGYTGVAHIHPASPGNASYSADSLQEITQVQVSIPWNASPVPREEDHVEIDTDSDPALVGKTLRIVEVVKGGIGFAVRVLICTFVEPNPFDPSA